VLIASPLVPSASAERASFGVTPVDAQHATATTVIKQLDFIFGFPTLKILGRFAAR